MPRKRKTTKLRRQVNEHGLRVFLETGHDFFSELTAEIMKNEELLKVYWRRWRDELIAERMVTHPGTRPAAWWWYERGMDQPDYQEERAWLEAHGLLTPQEKEKLAAWDRPRAAMRQR